MHHDEPQYRSVQPRVLRPLREFLRTESAGGAFLLVAAIVAIAWANSPWSDAYFDLWRTHVSLEAGPFSIEQDLRHWVNDGLMTIFFFVVALEIKREFLDGELSDRRAALLPVVAALGGMVAPALIYIAFNTGGEAMRGWGIPMATDIAFAVGVLVLVAPRLPQSAKVLLLSIAIVDDIGAIAVIALVYTEVLHVLSLGIAIAAIGCIIALRMAGVARVGVYVIPALILWAATLESGVHATIAGVVLGFLTPIRQRDDPREDLDGAMDRLQQEPSAERARDATRSARRSVSPGEWLEHVLHPWSSFLIIPIFALANAGVRFVGEDPGPLVASPVALGVAVGLVVGKAVGISAAAALAVRARAAVLPEGVGWRVFTGLAVLGGIGFTVSLFIGDLAFDAPDLVEQAKAGIFIGSVVAGVAGSVLVRSDASGRG